MNLNSARDFLDRCLPSGCFQGSFEFEFLTALCFFSGHAFPSQALPYSAQGNRILTVQAAINILSRSIAGERWLAMKGSSP
jgi:hypothetical protein